MAGSTLVRVSRDVHEKAKEYSHATGVPISRVFENAFNDWFKVVGSVHIEAFQGASIRLAEAAERGNVIQFRIQEAASV